MVFNPGEVLHLASYLFLASLAYGFAKARYGLIIRLGVFAGVVAAVALALSAFGFLPWITPGYPADHLAALLGPCAILASLILLVILDQKFPSKRDATLSKP